MNTDLFELFSTHGHDLFLVGGSVRDGILGVESDDRDFATDAHPDDICTVLSSAGFKVIPIGWDPDKGIAFGTIQTIIGEDKVEITTFRTHESYVKGSRKPKVVFGTSLKDDLIRRDFTVNTLARDGDGHLIDLFHGEQDLRDGIIRTPGDPVQSFTDDPLRILRACRFMARGIGKEIEASTFEAMIECAPLLSELSTERVFEEMTKLLLSIKPEEGLRILAQIGALKVLFPELQRVVEFNAAQGDYHHLTVWDHTLATVVGTPPKAEARWAALFHDVAKPECFKMREGKVTFRDHNSVGADTWTFAAKRLKVSNKFRHDVYLLIYEHQSLPQTEMKVKALRRLMHRVGDCLCDLFALVEADIRSHHPDVVDGDLADLAEMRVRVDAVLKDGSEVTSKLPHGTGDVVADALGLRPGPELGVVMRRLQKMMVEGAVTAESDFAKVAKGLV